MNSDRDEVITRAKWAVNEQPRHSDESLSELLAREFPDASDEDIEAAIKAAF